MANLRCIICTVIKRTQSTRFAGRPREIATPRRLNLYVEAEAAEHLARLAKELSQDTRRPVSLARALASAVGESPRFKPSDANDRKRKEDPMSLSQAILQGARSHRQARTNVFFEYDPTDRETPIGSTALGAAWVALGLEPRRLLTKDLHEWFPVLSTKLGSCPARADCGSWRTLEVQITHLEDSHGWNRVRVARWLEKRGL